MQKPWRLFAVIPLLATAALFAQPPAEPPPSPPSPKSLYESLRDVINVGAGLYNEQGDVAGCYRMYQGALLAIRPQLAGHPDLLKEVEDGLKKAETQPRLVDRAFVLRGLLDNVRATFKPADLTKKEPPKVDVPKVEETKKDDTKKEEAKKDEPKKDLDPNFTQLKGTVKYDGQPGPTGYLTLVDADNRIYSSFIHEDGHYAFRTPLPNGKYAVTIETAHKEKAPPPKGAYPEKYKDPKTSGLVAELNGGGKTWDLDLKKD